MKANGVPMRDLFGIVPHKTPETITPRSRQSESTLQGRYAEFMVCAYLTKLSYDVLHIDTQGYDLLLNCGGHNLRLDVKSTNRERHGTRTDIAVWSVAKGHWTGTNALKKRRPLTVDDCDILALFFTPWDSVAFLPVTKTFADLVRVPLSQLRSDPCGERSLKWAIDMKLTPNSS